MQNLSRVKGHSLSLGYLTQKFWSRTGAGDLCRHPEHPDQAGEGLLPDHLLYRVGLSACPPVLLITPGTAPAAVLLAL